MNNSSIIVELKQELDSIKEYVDSEICKKCQEMYIRLEECQKLIKDYIDNECNRQT
jgi:hypothetical protein